MNITDIKLCTRNPDDSLIVHASFAVRAQDRTNPYLLKAMTGLDVPEIIKTFNDGPAFFRLRPSGREVSFLIKLNPNYSVLETIGDLRDKIYKMIYTNTHAYSWNSESKIEIRFMENETYICSLFGVITKVETPQFSSESEIQVTIDCENLFLQSSDIINMGINNNPVPHNITRDGIDYPVSSFAHAYDSRSTAPHGFQINIQVMSDQDKLIIWDDRNTQLYLMWVVYDFVVGNVIHMSSNELNRFMFVSYNGEFQESLMNRYYWGSSWPYMLPGPNTFKISEGMRILSASFSDTYWGL